VTKRKISKVLKIARGTVYKYSCGEPEFLAESNRHGFSKLEPFQKEIISLINSKIIRQDVYHCIIKKGYTGGRTQFYKYCEHLADIEMIESMGNLRIDELRDEKTKLKYHYVTRKEIFQFIWNGEEESDISKDDIKLIKSTYPVIDSLIKCLTEFRDIFEKKRKKALKIFITTYKGCELAPIKQFTQGLQKDIEPVTNAVVEKYSNGFVEGNNNKLKLIKRLSYGRCKLPLLRAKVVLPGFFWS